MSQLNISVSTSCLRLIALLFLLMICISAKNGDSLSHYQYDINDEELKDLDILDSQFLMKNFNTRSDYSTIGSDHDLQYGSIRIIPFKKRTIPIEFQKALYAHGIVGRRR